MMKEMAVPPTRPTDWTTRISFDPQVCHGQACVAGTRVLVSVVLDSLAEGLTAAEIVKEYPSLALADVSACLAYAAELAHDRTIPLTGR
jgi:uncharacterized protein (DUF433 family)